MDGERLHIEQSPLKMLLILGAVAGFVAAGVWMVRIAPAGSFVQFIGWASIVFFGLCGVVWIRQMLAVRGVVVTIDGAGILDRRVSDQPIPWSKVDAVSTWSLDAQRFVILKLDPAFDAAFPTKAITRWTRGANRKLGADGIAINPQGLKISFELLLEAIVRFKTEWDDGRANV